MSKSRAQVVLELCADPIIRHDPEGKTTALSHEEQIARVKMGREDMGVHIKRMITHEDDSYVTSIWEITSEKHEDMNLCGIEVFKVEDGKLAHC
ncbi:MAG: hypothetical protein ACI9UU_001089 [Candidatus Azotimanducaceae bacterium]|jgi:hypothetical protein